MANVAPDGALHVASRRIEEGPTVTVREPWTGAELAQVVQADEERAEQAVVASEQAFERLRRSTSYERKMALARIARDIESRSEQFAELIALEAGKPIAMARAEVARGIATFE